MVLRSIFPFRRPVPTRFSCLASASVFVACFKLQGQERHKEGEFAPPPPPPKKKQRQFTTWLCCALLLHQSPDFFSPPGLRKQCKDEGVCDQGRMPYECLCSKNDTLGSLACHKGHPLKSKKAQKQGAKGWSISKEGDSYPSMAWYIRDVHFSGWKHCHCTASGACCTYTSSPLLMSRAAASLMHPPI